MLHLQKQNLIYNYKEIVQGLIDLLTYLDSVDLSITNTLCNDDDKIKIRTINELEYDTLYSNGEGKSICVSTRIVNRADKTVSRLFYDNGVLYRVSIINWKGSLEIFQIVIGHRRILVNDTWFDKSTFEEKAFFEDTKNTYPFMLSDISNILKDIGVLPK